MPHEFRLQGYVIQGELHVRDADCRRAVSDALKTGKEALIASHDGLLAALEDMLKFCDVKSNGESDWERSVQRARKVVAKAKRAS